MGCDIHLYVEKLQDGKWVAVDKWLKEEDENEGLYVDYNDSFYTGRNYDLFAILADVRNGRGFAGIPTGEGFIPISEPKGLPGDVSPEIKQSSDHWGVDGHSHSYFTVEELISYDWTQTSKLYGVINAPEFAKWNRWRRGNGQGPESYCGEIFGGNIKSISNEEMEMFIKDKSEEEIAKLSKFVTRVKWTETYYEAAKDFWWKTMPRLFRVGKPNEVRIVFWFDN